MEAMANAPVHSRQCAHAERTLHTLCIGSVRGEERAREQVRGRVTWEGVVRFWEGGGREGGCSVGLMNLPPKGARAPCSPLLTDIKYLSIDGFFCAPPHPPVTGLQHRAHLHTKLIGIRTPLYLVISGAVYDDDDVYDVKRLQ